MNKKRLFIGSIVIILIVVAVILIWHYLYVRPWNLAPYPNMGTASAPTSKTPATIVSSTTSATIASQPASPVSKTYEYHVNAPNTLMLVDSQGRRTGENPVTGTLYHEIPGTSYSEEGMSPTNQIGDLIVQGVSDGQYALYVLGGKTGSYWVGIAGSPSQTIYGNIDVGTMAAYTIGYSELNTASSGLPSFQGISSSTASITAAPPNNLPPPAIP
jgi:hypothetical protein